MLNTVVGIETFFTINQELPLSADGLASANTKYLSDGPHVLNLPPVEGVGAVPVGTAVLLEQVVGTGTVEDNVSEVADDNSGVNLASISILEGTTVGFILVIAYGRLQWMILPSILTGGAPPSIPPVDRLKTVNGGLTVVNTGDGVQQNPDTSYSLNNPLEPGSPYVGMHIGPPAATGETLYIIKVW